MIVMFEQRLVAECNSVFNWSNPDATTILVSQPHEWSSLFVSYSDRVIFYKMSGFSWNDLVIIKWFGYYEMNDLSQNEWMLYLHTVAWFTIIFYSITTNYDETKPVLATRRGVCDT